MTVISYASWDEGLSGYPAMLRQLIAQYQPSSICDVGGGAAAALTLDEVAGLGVEYTLLDISAEELAKAPDGYHKVVADIAADHLSQTVGSRFDLVQSHMLAEHVADARRFHHNVYDLLSPGGVAVHLFPTLWEPAFVLNRMLPERLTHKMLTRLQPERRLHSDQGKFPAYYRWCRGPGKRELARLHSIGYEVLVYRGFFGTGYLQRLPGFVRRLSDMWTRALLRHPVPALTSYAMVVLRRPDQAPV